MLLHSGTKNVGTRPNVIVAYSPQQLLLYVQCTCMYLGIVTEPTVANPPCSVKIPIGLDRLQCVVSYDANKPECELQGHMSGRLENTT